jgi:hypothetical protein
MLHESFVLLMFGCGFLALVAVAIPVSAIIYGAMEYRQGAPFIASVKYCLKNY